jgi:hypothetical protein
MARYSPFTGGPAATDVSGLFAQFDSGAIARGVASAGKSIGDALAQKYAQAAKDKKDSAMWKNIRSTDLGSEILDHLQISKEQESSMTDSQLAGLIPQYQQSMTLSALGEAQELKQRTERSGKALQDGIAILNEAPASDDAVQNLDELRDKMDLMSGYDFVPEDFKTLNAHFQEKLDEYTKRLPPEVVDIKGLPKDLTGIMTPSGVQVMNTPSKTETRSPEQKFTDDLLQAETDLQNNPDDPAAKRRVQVMRAFEIDKTTPSGSMRIIRDAEGNPIYEEVSGSAVATATRNEAEKFIDSYGRGIDELDAFFYKIEPQFLGLEGEFKEVAIDNFVGQFFPKDSAIRKESKKRISVRQGMRLWAEGVLRNTTGDTRFNKDDRVAIEQILAKPNAWTTYDKAIISMSQVRKKFQMAARRKLKQLNIPKEEWDITLRSPAQIQEEFKDGTLDRYNASAAMARMNPQFKEWLGKSFGEVLEEFKLNANTWTRSDMNIKENLLKEMYPKEYQRIWEKGRALMDKEEKGN